MTGVITNVERFSVYEPAGSSTVKVVKPNPGANTSNRYLAVM